MTDRQKFMLAALLLLVTLGYGLFQWAERSALVIEANALNAEASNLTGLSKTLTEEYQSIKSEVSAEREVADQKLALVFPTTEDITTLTRLFDDFSVKNNFASNPFFISGITYGTVQTADDGTYRYVPVNLSLSTSKKNLSKFLETIETSGSLEGEIRLMSTGDLSLTYPEEFGGAYEARITVNAYFSQSI